MFKRKRKAFTLIELIAVLVIMAIIALIVTPLVMNIIRKVRISADKRSIDAYGRSIEIAIAGYLLDNGTFPTSIGQLIIEYSGDEVVCSTTQLNGDSSVYLTGCTVGGRSVDYAYGHDLTTSYTAYSVGDEVSYNNVDYYVIADSGVNEENVTLLKAEPLSYEEVQTYSAGTGANIFNQNGYGAMEYHASSSEYNGSYVKTTVDAWAVAKAPAASDARLITYTELTDLAQIMQNETPSGTYDYLKLQYDWAYNGNYSYWSMTPYTDSAFDVWYISSGGTFSYQGVGGNGSIVVRPVIILSKSLISA